jgi:hypothetical protein
LLEKESANSYEELNEIPSITHFNSEKESINLGERVRLYLEVSNPLERGLHYFWQISGGGIEEDCKGNIFYYGSEKGKHIIKVFVANTIELLSESPPLEIEVCGCAKY